MSCVLTSTVSGTFTNQPDQIKVVTGGSRGQMVYFCEDGTRNNGVFASDDSGRVYTILDGGDKMANSETSGLAFSPDRRVMYVTYHTLMVHCMQYSEQTVTRSMVMWWMLNTTVEFCSRCVSDVKYSIHVCSPSDKTNDYFSHFFY